ncbi:MAG: S8 family serine peptidase, partial [Limisphaerales bacterium]
MKKRVFIGLCLLMLAIAALIHRDSRMRESKSKHRASATPTENVSEENVPNAAARNDTIATNEPAAAKPKRLESIDRDPMYPHRLNNSYKTPSELFRSETAILLRNALIDTGEDLDKLAIPEHLRAEGDPGSYIVQVAGKSSPAFLQLLARAEAKVVSYIPHNSYLVTANESSIASLRKSPFVRAAVPYEPYYKLDRRLLPVAIDQKAMERGKLVRLALFPGTRNEGMRKILESGAIVFEESEFPYGPLVTVFPPSDSLVKLAQIPEVQLVETFGQRVLLNELSRVRVGVATNGEVANIHGLTGNGTVIGINDSGVDRSHNDLVASGGSRVIYDSTNFTTTISDGTGHGTHVAGIIAGDGDTTPPVFTNGSTIGHIYAGKAPSASLYPLSILPALAEANFTSHGAGVTNHHISSVTVTFGSGGYDHVPSVFLFDLTAFSTNGSGGQETPGFGASLEVVTNQGQVVGINVLSQGTNYNATNTFLVMTAPWSDFQLVTNHGRHTNIYTVNNSWGTTLQEYDTTAAIYDAAVRDSMPHWPGEQGINWVFSAGNSGFGTTDGQSGINDSIESPGTAKNVITVGSSCSWRKCCYFLVLWAFSCSISHVPTRMTRLNRESITLSRTPSTCPGTGGSSQCTSPRPSSRLTTRAARSSR